MQSRNVVRYIAVVVTMLGVIHLTASDASAAGPTCPSVAIPVDNCPVSAWQECMSRFPNCGLPQWAGCGGSPATLICQYFQD